VHRRTPVCRVVICIIREDLLAKVPANLPNLLDYKTLAERTPAQYPPCWSVYIVSLVMKWAKVWVLVGYREAQPGQS